MAELCEAKDTKMINNDAYQAIFSCIGDAIEACNMHRTDVPIPSGEEVKTFINELNLHTVENLNLTQTPSDYPGWQAKASEVVEAFIEINSYTSSNDSVAFDTLVMAFGTDKCPFPG